MVNYFILNIKNDAPVCNQANRGMDKISKGQIVRFAEEETAISITDKVVAEAKDKYNPPSFTIIHIDYRDASFFVFNKEEVCQTVSPETDIFAHFLLFNERLNGRKSSGVATLFEESRESLNVSHHSQEAFDSLLEGAFLDELLRREFALGLLRLILGQPVVQVTVPVAIPGFVREAVPGFLASDCGYRDILEEREK